MKQLFLIVGIVIFFNSLIFSQTEWEYLGFAGSGFGAIYDIEIDGNGNIFAALGPIYKSSDNGATWELKSNGLPSGGGTKLDHYNNQIYLATFQGLYKTTNGGDSWFRIAQSLPFTYFDEVRIIPNGYIFTSVFDIGTGGVFRSTNEGINWESTSFTGLGARDIGINANGVMFFSINTLSGFGTYRSFDLGINWELSTTSIGAEALEYLNDGNILIGGEPGPTGPGIYKSTTNGDTWFDTNTFNEWNNIFTDFTLDINNDIYVSVGGAEQGVYLSADGGSSWEYRGLATVEIYCLAIDSSGYVYAGTYNNGILRTPGRTIPVELISFNAVVLEKDVFLDWITATETNNQGFEILRKAQNDKEWNDIGFVPGYGTTTEPKTYSFIDNEITNGIYKYRLNQIDFDGTFEYSNELEVEFNFTPKEFALEQNYPNPFNPITTIKYQIPELSFVTIKVYDVLGNEIATLVSEEKPAGSYEIEFDGNRLTSGIYFYRINAGDFVETKKMLLLK